MKRLLDGDVFKRAFCFNRNVWLGSVVLFTVAQRISLFERQSPANTEFPAPAAALGQHPME
jgi:hypothetical protein